MFPAALLESDIEALRERIDALWPDTRKGPEYVAGFDSMKELVQCEIDSAVRRSNDRARALNVAAIREILEQTTKDDYATRA